MRSSPVPPPDSALVLGYTASADEFERRIFLGEAETVAGLFGAAPLLDTDARGGAIRARATSSAVVHFSCHGYFNGADPLDSAVILADGPFTGRDFMQLELQADLVTLSSCRSGFTLVGRGDEITGMSRALLYAGTSSALLTLWAVEARSTLDWMLDFYTSDAPPVMAFREATLALRESLGDPRLWAPFILVGFPRSPTSGWS
jgi:CHAT domain-containing protein